MKDTCLQFSGEFVFLAMLKSQRNRIMYTQISGQPSIERKIFVCDTALHRMNKCIYLENTTDSSLGTEIHERIGKNCKAT